MIPRPLRDGGSSPPYCSADPNKRDGTCRLTAETELMSAFLPGFDALPPEIPIFMVAAWGINLLLRGMGRDIPILETTVVVYVMQLLVGAWISYRVPPDFARYQMAVPESVYFSFAIPAVCAFLVPICVARRYLPRLDQVMTFEAGPAVFKAGVLICILGFGFLFVSRSAPVSLQFVCFLGSELRFVGALYCYFSRHRQRRWPGGRPAPWSRGSGRTGRGAWR